MRNAELEHPVRRGPSLSIAVGIHNLTTRSDGSRGSDLIEGIGILLSDRFISNNDGPRFDAIINDPEEYNPIKNFGYTVLEVIKADRNFVNADKGFCLNDRDRYVSLNLKYLNEGDSEKIKKVIISVGKFLKLHKKKLPKNYFIGITSSDQSVLKSGNLWSETFFPKDGKGIFKKPSGDYICFRTYDEIIRFAEANQSKKA